MKELLEQAVNFLKTHPEINEVELEDQNIRVHLVRFTPIPVTYSGYTYPVFPVFPVFPVSTPS